MGNVYQQFEQAHGATAQVFAYLGLPEEIQDSGNARLPPFSQQRGISTM